MLSHEWYFGPDPAEEATSPAAPTSFWDRFGLLPNFRPSAVRFSIVLSALPYSLSAAFVHALVTVTDLTALESTANAAAEKAAKRAGGSAAPASAFDLDREMGAIGIANLAGACVGAMPNYIQLSPSVIALRFTQGRGRPGPYAAVIISALLPLLDDVVALVPRFVIGGFVFEMGACRARLNCVALAANGWRPHGNPRML